MLHTALIEQEIEIGFIELVLPVRYDDEDIPHDFPLRKSGGTSVASAGR